MSKLVDEIKRQLSISKSEITSIGSPQVVLDGNVLLKELEKLEMTKKALSKIQNAYGSPEDEDFVTTIARETINKL